MNEECDLITLVQDGLLIDLGVQGTQHAYIATFAYPADLIYEDIDVTARAVATQLAIGHGFNVGFTSFKANETEGGYIHVIDMLTPIGFDHVAFAVKYNLEYADAS